MFGFHRLQTSSFNKAKSNKNSTIVAQKNNSETKIDLYLLVLVLVLYWILEKELLVRLRRDHFQQNIYRTSDTSIYN